MLSSQNLNFSHFPKLSLQNKIHKSDVLKQEMFSSFSFSNNDFIFLRKKIKMNLKEKIYKYKAGFILEVLLHGLNFSAKRIKYLRKPYFIDTHKSEIFILKEHIVNEFKSRIHKRRIVFFSYNKSLLDEISRKIKSFRPPNTYTGKGIFARGDLYFTKVGKIRNRK